MDTLTEREKKLVSTAVRATLAEMGIKEPKYLSKNQADKKYGEGIVDRWIRQGRITFERRGTARNSKKVAPADKLKELYEADKNISVIIKS